VLIIIITGCFFFSTVEKRRARDQTRAAVPGALVWRLIDFYIIILLGIHMYVSELSKVFENVIFW
jgi:hypothetical protein